MRSVYHETMRSVYHETIFKRTVAFWIFACFLNSCVFSESSRVFWIFACFLNLWVFGQEKQVAREVERLKASLAEEQVVWPSLS